MDYLNESDFNPERPQKMLVDINSCFATIEQQANPLLQGKEVAVAAYENEGGCILAASREAKILGIKTGWRVSEAKKICPNLVVLTPDPAKYRFVHRGLKKILLSHSPEVVSKSIDEFTIDFTGIKVNLWEEALKIKEEIRQILGEWITVSIGIGANFFLAKLASNLQKPDGLVWIDKSNYRTIYENINTEVLPGIGFKNSCKLAVNGIQKVTDFYKCSRQELRAIFHSIWADYWYWRLRGFEIDDKKREFKKSFSAIISLKKPAKNRQELAAIYFQLCLKVGRRCQKEGHGARGVAWWTQSEGVEFEGHLKSEVVLINGWEIYEKIYPKIPEFKGVVKKAVVVIYDLDQRAWQEDIFGEREKLLKKYELAIKINEKYGEGSIIPGSILGKQRVADFIGFGNLE